MKGGLFLQELIIESTNNQSLSLENKKEIITKLTDNLSDKIEKIILLPPDSTRKHSGIGELTELLYFALQNKNKKVDIMPALGTHSAMDKEQLQAMFGSKIPLDRFIVHNWREDPVKIGTIPEAYVKNVSENILKEEIEVKVNKRLVNGSYDLIISLGQVIPHAVIGMSNYSKNIFVGCGGPDMINKTHFLGGAYGLERLLGEDHSPVRKLFDYAEKNLIKDLPLIYLFTTNSLETNKKTGNTDIMSIFIGRKREVFEKAVKSSQKHNITKVNQPLKKVVVYLEEKFKSTWLGNKAIYRTRKALADDAELIIIAPGLKEFGEDLEINKLIKKYGYSGKEKILEAVNKNQDIQENLSAAGHLIRGSADGRFKITYACRELSQAEIENVNYNYLDLNKAMNKYQPDKLKYGYNKLDTGEEIFFIDNPTTGLWSYEG
jgi:nickel-dependent lactate racemase